MLSNTGLYATQPSRFEKFENGDDFLSYAPISDLSLSGTSPLPDLSNQPNDPFLSCFTSAEYIDTFDDWSSEETLTNWETSDLETTMDQSMDWASSPATSVSNGAFSPINGSSKHTSMSFDQDFSLDIPQATAETSTTSTPSSEGRSASPESSSSPNLSQDEIAKLWTIAFPDSRLPTPFPENTSTTTTPKDIPTPLPVHAQKRKSITPLDIPSFPQQSIETPSYPAPKKRHTMPAETDSPSRPTRTTGTKRGSPTPTTNGVKGSKVNHNLIEKRYRSSLNEKIALLRDALPRNYGSSSGSSDEEGDMFVKKEEFVVEGCGVQSEGKVSTKGAVLSDAARYIRFLEGKVMRLEERLNCGEGF